MVNILPKKEQHELITAYYARLASTFLILAALVILIGGALLAPSYILLSESTAASERFTQAVTQTLTLKNKSANTSVLPALSEQARLVGQITRPPELPGLLSGILAAQSKNIQLSKIDISFDQSTPGAGMLALTGTSASREALVAFVDALKKNAAFAGASVPVQNLAGDTDIPFTLSFAYSLP